MSSLRTIIRSGRWCAYCRQPPRISITPSVVRPKEVPLPDQLQDTSKDESLCCFRDCDFISGDCLLSSVDCILSSGCDEQCSSVPLRGRLRKSTANTVVVKALQHHPKLQDFEMYVYKCLEKYCSVAKPFRSNYRSLDPIYGFYFDCAVFPNQKRNEK